VQVNPNPEKFDMRIAQGVKDAADVDDMGADAPDIEVPFCKAHGRWPCITCGTKHFEDCACSFCVEPVADPLADVREAAGYAVGIIRGMLFHWKKAGIKAEVDELERYARLLTKFSDGDL